MYRNLYLDSGPCGQTEVENAASPDATGPIKAITYRDGHTSEACILRLTSVGHRVRRVLMRSRSFWLFAATGFAELAALLLIGETTMSVKAVAVICLLVVWVGGGSRVAWWLFVAANSLVLLTTWVLVLGSGSGTGGSGGGTQWGNVIVVSVGSAALLVLLLSPAMRRREHAT